jgi:hypothetical protein
MVGMLVNETSARVCACVCVCVCGTHPHMCVDTMMCVGRENNRK